MKFLYLNIYLCEHISTALIIKFTDSFSYYLSKYNIALLLTLSIYSVNKTEKSKLSSL